MNILDEKALQDCRIEKRDEDLWWRAGEREERVGNLVRCFPASSPDRWLSIRAESGEEMALIRRVEDLDSTSRAVLEPVLREKYHIPVIVRIDDIEGSAAGKRIRVQTRDDGEDTLDINSETDVDFRQYPRVTLNDRTRRRKYVIEDAEALDGDSRDLIRRHLRTPGRRGRRFR